MKKYESYKESGYDWFGLIPDSWQVRPLKYLFSICSGSTPDTNNLEFWDGGIKWITPADYKTDDKFVSGGRKTITERGLKSCSSIVLPIGSIVFSKRAPIGSLAITSEELCTNQGCLGCIPNGVNSEYYYYCMSILKEAFELYGSGTTFKEISASDFSNFKIVVPSLDEQEAIANYLDYKTSQIDAAISAIDSQIEDLNAYRQSIISEAVTKGLNPNAPMRDSGIEWIGEIPEGWNLCKTKFVLSKLQDGTHGTFERVDTGFPLLSAKNITEKGIYIGENESYISKKDHDSIVSNGIPQKGDVALCCVGSIGRSCIYSFDYPISFQRSVTFLRPNSRIVSTYLNFYICSSYFQDQLSKLAKTSAQSGVYLGNVANSILVLPPLSEQQAIASYLDNKSAKIDASIKALEAQRDDLNALKKSVISEAVTGKIDVRDWTPINE